MDFPYGETVTVQTPATSTDRYGKTVTDWSNPATRPESCAVGPGGSSEPSLDARAAIDSDFDLFFDHDPAIVASERVVVRGLVCDVDGHPFSWRSPFSGWEPGTVVRVKIREG